MIEAKTGGIICEPKDIGKALILCGEAWFSSLIDDCQGILTEGIHAYRWELLRTYHELGTRIKESFGEFKRANIYGERLCDTIAESLSIKSKKGKPGLTIKPRLIYQCLQFVEKYPDINTLPEGKNCSWNKMVHKYLPEHKEEKKKPTLADRIKRFIKDMYPEDRRKEFIASVVKEWENYNGR